LSNPKEISGHKNALTAQYVGVLSSMAWSDQTPRLRHLPGKGKEQGVRMTRIEAERRGQPPC
jgi:hypothetical protein